MKKTALSSLIHDVGKYVARTAHNLDPDGPLQLSPELIQMFAKDLFALPPNGERASARIAAARKESFGASIDEALDKAHRLALEVDSLEPALLRGEPQALRRAIPLAKSIETLIRGVRSRTPKLLLIDDGDRSIELAHQFLRQYRYATRCDRPGPCWTCPKRQGCTLTHAHDAAEVEETLDRHQDVDVVLLDVHFELDENRLLPVEGYEKGKWRHLQGLAILRHLRKKAEHLPVILMTSKLELDLLYEGQAPALLADEMLSFAGTGAFDARALGLLIERILARSASPLEESYALGKTRAMARLHREATVLARTSLPILLLGETGTGKSALAEAVIHKAARRSGPFVAVDLASLPETLVAAELFGVAKGAYSGAVERPGRFEQAHGGTLFLDEIGNVPLEVQRLLLLALQDRRVTRLGENLPRPVDVKVVAATHVDLGLAVQEGRFRADLYARLNPATSLVLPPLRERLSDLEELLSYFLRRRFAGESDRDLLRTYLAKAGHSCQPTAELVIGKSAKPEDAGVSFVLAPSLLSALRAHPFPGNLRELEHLISSAALLALADALHALTEGRSGAAGLGRVIPIPARLVLDLLERGWPRQTPPSSPAATLLAKPGKSLRQVAQELERQYYQRLFTETGGDFDAMARRLLSGGDEGDGRRVRLRFNQLGLRVKKH